MALPFLLVAGSIAVLGLRHGNRLSEVTAIAD
jgi:hypothetical protein